MRFEAPGRRKLLHEVSIPIRWGDMDAMGHVNNAVYFRYLETARIDWCTGLGCTPGPGEPGPVIVNAWCNFMRQLRYPGTVLVRHHATTVGRTSFDTYVTIDVEGDPGPVWAEGGARMVWFDPVANRALALPDWLRAKVSGA